MVAFFIFGLALKTAEAFRWKGNSINQYSLQKTCKIRSKTALKTRIFGKRHMQQKPNIRPHLLWEYDLKTFNWKKSYKIVIERVIQLGTMEDWKAILAFYPIEQIHETIGWSNQLDSRDKSFAKLFLQSDYFHAA